VPNEENTKDMARKAIKQFGKIDILINNAGIFASLGKKPFYEISSKEWDQGN
jgi:NAD(P)-dependent dehydrogenase (short-subunit alcohol dehydrogenase family)